MSDEEIQRLFGTPALHRSSVLELYGPQAALLWLLYKLGVIGMRRVVWSYGKMLTQNTLEPPPCSIPLSVYSVHKEWLQFCPKRMADPEFKEYKPK